MTDNSAQITRREVLDLCEAIYAAGPLLVFKTRVLRVFLCVLLTLTYLRHNPPQGRLAEIHGIWQALPHVSLAPTRL